MVTVMTVMPPKFALAINVFSSLWTLCVICIVIHSMFVWSLLVKL